MRVGEAKEEGEEAWPCLGFCRSCHLNMGRAFILKIKGWYIVFGTWSGLMGAGHLKLGPAQILSLDFFFGKFLV